MTLFCTLPNTGTPNKVLALIDPFKEEIEIFGFNWSDEIDGTTGLEKNDFGWTVVTQNSDKTNGIVFLSNHYEFEGYIPLRKVKDAHSMVFCNGLLYICSPGNNSIYEIWLYPYLKIDETLYYCFEDHEEIDKIHINSIDLHQAGKINGFKSFVITAFGEKETELWSSTKDGKIYHLMEKEKGKIECRVMKNNLKHPHTFKMIDNFFESYCESLTGDFVVGNQSINLGGYTRGMAYDKNYYYVGISESRNTSKSTGEEVKELHPDQKAAVCVINRNTFKLVKRFIVSEQIKELYDLEIVE